MEREGGMIADALECKQSLTGLAGLTGDTASCCLDFASLLEQHQPQQAYPLSVEKLGIKSLQFYHPYCDLKEYTTRIQSLHNSSTYYYAAFSS